MRATRPTGRTTPMTRPNGTPTAMAIPNPNASDWRLVAVALRIAPERRSATSAVSVAHGDGKLKLIGTRAAHPTAGRTRSPRPLAARRPLAPADVLQHGLERRRIEELLRLPLGHGPGQIARR